MCFRSFDGRPWYRANDTQNDKAKRAYRAVKTVSLRRLNTPAYKQFQRKVQKLAHDKYHYKEKTGKDYQVGDSQYFDVDVPITQ